MTAPRLGQVVAHADGVLEELLRIVAPLANGQARKDVVRSVDELVRDQLVLPVEVGVAHLDLLKGGVAQHLGPGADHVDRGAIASRGLRRMFGARDLREVVAPVPIRSAHRTVVGGLRLPVAAAKKAVLNQLGRKSERLPGQRRRRRQNGVGLVLAFVRQEEVCLVLDQRPAERRANLLIGIRQDAIGDEVFGDPFIVAEVAVDAAVVVVGARARDGLHLDAERPALGDVEQVGDDLELSDRLAAEFRLAKHGAGHLLGDLLAVQVQLELPIAHSGRGIDGVGGDALDLHRQLHPVASL